MLCLNLAVITNAKCDVSKVILQAQDTTPEEVLSSLYHCGVVALNGTSDVSFARDLRSRINEQTASWLESRNRVREALSRAMLAHRSLKQVWKEVENERLFQEGNVYRCTI